MTPDVRVTSWRELIDALYDIPKTDFGRHRSDYVYRGVGDQSWDLKTSLIRLGSSFPKVERTLLRSFRKYAQPAWLPPGNLNLWIRLAIAQHHGLPPRVLDWTVSPRVAAHFATAEAEHYDKDGAIWCIDVKQCRDLLPPELRHILGTEYAYLFSVEMLDAIASLDEFDHLAARGNFVLFFEPPSLDARIVNQGAVMSVMPGAGLTVDGLLREHPRLFRRIIIPKELKWEIRDKLDQDNVTERMLFPGLPGLSDWLKRYYGPGSGQA
jgi:FRG domain